MQIGPKNVNNNEKSKYDRQQNYRQNVNIMKALRCQRVRAIMQKILWLMLISDRKIYNSNKNLIFLHDYTQHSMIVRVYGTCYVFNFQHEQITTM